MNFNATLIGQSIAFVFFVWFCMRYVWPPLVKALDERQQKIADGLAAAEKAQRELAEADTQVALLLKQAREDARVLIDQAEKRGNQIIEDAKEQARIEGARIITAAQADIAQQTSQAREVLRQQVAGLAVVGAERILGEHMDQAANSKLLDDLVAKL